MGLDVDSPWVSAMPVVTRGLCRDVLAVLPARGVAHRPDCSTCAAGERGTATCG